MNETLKEELQALALYLRGSGADNEYKIKYVADKIEVLIQKYGEDK